MDNRGLRKKTIENSYAEIDRQDDTRVCGFTGHRDIPPEDLRELPAALDRVIQRMVERGIVSFMCGGAMGFDTLAAEAVLRARERDGRIKLMLALPCKDQGARWPSSAQRRYYSILERADKVTYVSEEYHSGCMLKRNDYMIANSFCVVAYCKNKQSGTAYTLRRAGEAGIFIVNIVLKHDIPPLKADDCEDS